MRMSQLLPGRLIVICVRIPRPQKRAGRQDLTRLGAALICEAVSDADPGGRQTARYAAGSGTAFCSPPMPVPWAQAELTCAVGAERVFSGQTIEQLCVACASYQAYRLHYAQETSRFAMVHLRLPGAGTISAGQPLGSVAPKSAAKGRRRGPFTVSISGSAPVSGLLWVCTRKIFDTWAKRAVREYWVSTR